MWVRYNPNPSGKNVGDCTVRAITKILDKNWDETYSAITLEGLLLCDMPSSNHVWGTYLKHKGFRKCIIDDSFPDDYSVNDFCKDNPTGKYVLALNGHVVAVENGNYFDSWDCGNEIPLYYFKKESD